MQIQKADLPRILMVGTTPYHPNASSRALETYFRDYPTDKIRMIFSNADVPMKWRCESYYQITDYDVLQAFLRKTKSPGRIFDIKDLQEISLKDKEEHLGKFKKKTWLRYYARYFLWKSHHWLSDQLEQWVEEFKPEAIYICFSDDYFILDISYYFAKKYNIPVIAQIGDDYYFKANKNPLMKPYLAKYKKLFHNIMDLPGFGVYISDKLADFYNSNFKLQGYPFYLSSSIVAKNKPIQYEFNYFGKIELGRYRSLAILGDALYQIGQYELNVYSSPVSKKIMKHLKKHHCIFQGEVPYAKAQEIMNSGSFNVIASGFDKKDIESSRYSLSTKVSDSLASSGPIIAIGPSGDGAIDFLKERKCAIILRDEEIDVESLRKTILDEDYLMELIDNAHSLGHDLFVPDKNSLLFLKQCQALLGNGNNNE